MTETGIVDIGSRLKAKDQKMEEKKKRASKPVDAKPVRKMTKKEQQIIEMANNTKLPHYYETVWSEEHLQECVDWLSKQDVIAVDTETMGINPFMDEIVGISFYAPHKGFYIPLKHVEHVEEIPVEVIDDEGKPLVTRLLVNGQDYVKCLPKDLVSSVLKPLLEDRRKKFLAHNGKFDSHILRNWLGIHITWFYDTMIGQAILDENQSKALKDLAPFYLKVEADKFSTLFGKVTFDKVPIKLNPFTHTGNLASYYAIKDTELTYRLAEFQLRHLNKPQLADLKKLVFEIEMPFLDIVVRAESRGVLLDENYLVNKVAVELHADLERLRQKIWAVTGEINLNAPAQVAEALYVKLGLPRVNQDKPNSTDKKTLTKLKGQHEVVGDILDFKAKSKLTQAFADKLPKAIVNGRIHTSFNTVGTKTGRMSSSSPNLQQIPANVGGLIRNAFIADKGRLLASIDFSGQELRVLCHLSQCPVMMDAYANGKDLHSITGTGIWNNKHPDEQVTYEYFEYCRGMTGLFRDKDGNLLEDKLEDATYVSDLFDANKINALDVDTLRKDAEIGVKFEKTRKQAKTVKNCESLLTSA